MDEEAANKKVFPCSTCYEEVQDYDPALLWEVGARRVCNRPSVELYILLSVTSSKELMFTCMACRRKGALARQLAEVNITLSSMRMQVSIYERLFNERQQLLQCLASEKDVLQLENAFLHDQLANARQSSDNTGVHIWDSGW